MIRPAISDKGTHDSLCFLNKNLATNLLLKFVARVSDELHSHKNSLWNPNMFTDYPVCCDISDIILLETEGFLCIHFF